MVQAFEGQSRPRPLRPAPASPRVPPHDLEAEESLLGAMLLSGDATAEAVQICGPADFYKPAHGHIFAAIVALFERGEPADAITVADELRRAGLLDAVGDPGQLLSLQTDAPSITNAKHYATIVEEHALLRRLVGVAADIAEIGYSVPGDVSDALDRSESLVFDLAQRRTTESMKPLREALDEGLERLEELGQRSGRVTGMATGYHEVDEILAGLQRQSLTIIGARPAMGKTSLGLGILTYVGAVLHRPALLFSLEMNHLELTQRLLASEARVDAQRLRTGRLHDPDWGKVGNAVSRLDGATIFIDDNPNLTVMDIRARARRLRRSEGDLGVVVVDYLQLMTGRAKAENRQVEVAEISRGLKILARELDCPVVALSQLSRNLEARQDKRPMLSDLRESGCVPGETPLARADNGEEVTIGELVLSHEQPLVWSLDDGGNLVARRVLRAFPSGSKPVFRLGLASGLEVEATSNHPFFSTNGWRALGDLRQGDRLAVPRRLPSPQEVSRWDEDELVLLAHLVGHGDVGSTCSCAAGDPRRRGAVLGAARRRFGVGARVVQGDPARGRPEQIQLVIPAHGDETLGRSHPMRRWLEDLGLWDCRPEARRIPGALFRAPDDQLARFASHLWAAQAAQSAHAPRDASRPRDAPAAGVPVYDTTSRTLAEGLRRLLLRLGVASSVEVSQKVGELIEWRVRPEGVDGARLAALLRGAGCLQNGQTETTGTRATHHGPDVAWDEIVEITYVGEKPTFDATVEGTHNFVANGIVAHNSLEQDADVVLFIYREEQYDPDTPLDRRGTAEIIVAKHRNGPTGLARLGFVNQFARFDNLASM